jgi:hypothetical protein
LLYVLVVSGVGADLAPALGEAMGRPMIGPTPIP